MTLVAHMRGEKVERAHRYGRAARDAATCMDRPEVQAAAPAGPVAMTDAVPARRASRCAASQAIRRHRRPRRRRPRGRRRRSVRPGRPERRRQEHAHGDPRRARSARTRGHDARRRAVSPAHPLEARRAGVAMIYQELSLAPDVSVDGEHHARRRARAVWHSSLARARARHALGARSPSSATFDSIPMRRSATLSLAEQQIVEIARAHRDRLPGARARRADQQPRARGLARLFALIRRLKRTGHADRLHLALHRRGARGLPTASSCCAMAGSRAAATATMSRVEIVSLMVGGTSTICSRERRARQASRLLQVDALEPGSATLHAAPRRDCRHRRASSAPGARACCARFSASSRCGAGASGSAHSAGAPRRGSGGRRAWACVSEDRKGEGLALGLAWPTT